MTNRFRCNLLASTIFFGAAAMVASPAQAQSTQPAEPVADTDADAVQEAVRDDGEILVTGSRIARPNLTSNSPIAVVTGEQIVENGDVTLDTFLNTLPQVNPSGTSTSNNPGNSGRSNVNLRGLGSNRNLVLVDGRRPMVSDQNQTVDLNTIPAALIERLDVVTGGAGATYGADAIAGVVNIILRRDFEGIDLRASYSNTLPDPDARELQLSAVLGANFAGGRGNLAIAFDYSDRQPLIKAQRDFAAQATSTTGSPPVGRFIETSAIPQAAITNLFATYGVPAAQAPISGLSQIHFNSDGSLFGGGTFNNPLQVSNYRYDPLGRDGAAANQNFFPDFYSYNFDAINLLVLPLERMSAFVRGNYEIDPAVEVFVQAGYTEYTSQTALAPTPVGVAIYAPGAAPSAQFATSPLITGTSAIFNNVVPVTNPFIPADLRTILNARTGDDASLVGSGATEPFRLAIRTLGTGLRVSEFENEVIQVLGGIRGEITEDWRYEAYYSWGRTTIDQAASGNVNVLNLQRLLEAADGGNSLCAGGYNPFGIQPLSQACVTYLDETGFTQTTFTQNIALGYVTGKVAELPAGDVSAVLGAENRRFRYEFDPGALFGPIAGFNTALPINGTNSFTDFFGELFVPLLRDQPWARSLELSLGFRLSESENENVQTGVQGASNSSTAYKAELSWQPLEAVRLRASYQHSVRAPNFGELFSGGSSFVTAFDPCSVTTTFRTSGGDAARTLCVQTGVGRSVASTNRPTTAPTATETTAANAFVATPGAQLNLALAGNPNLAPEEADTFTAGAVVQFGNFTGSIDYYRIDISDPIFGADTNLIVAACYGYQGNLNPTRDPNNIYCQTINRAGSSLSNLRAPVALGGTASGELILLNRGGISTQGVDVQLNYRQPTDFAGEGSALNFNLLVNYLLNYEVEELPGVVLDYAGSAAVFGAGLGQSFPELRGTLNVAWDFGALELSSRVRYIHDMINRASIQFPGEVFTGPESATYVDLAMEAQFNPNFTFRLGINNVFDLQPPTYSPNVQSGTDPSLYDVIGRRFVVSTRLRF